MDRLCGISGVWHGKWSWRYWYGKGILHDGSHTTLLWFTVLNRKLQQPATLFEACWDIRDGPAYVMDGSVDSIARQVWIARRWLWRQGRLEMWLCHYQSETSVRQQHQCCFYYPRLSPKEILKQFSPKIPRFLLCSLSCLHVRTALPAFPAHRTRSNLLSASQLQHALLPRPLKHVQPNPGILLQTFESDLTNSSQASHDSVLF